MGVEEALRRPSAEDVSVGVFGDVDKERSVGRSSERRWRSDERARAAALGVLRRRGRCRGNVCDGSAAEGEERTRALHVAGRTHNDNTFTYMQNQVLQKGKSLPSSC